MNAYKVQNFNKRRALKMQAAISDFVELDWLELINQYGCCVYCMSSTSGLTRDHKIPLVRGGNHTKSNVVPACQSCNSKKGAKTHLEYLISTKEIR